MVKKRTYLDSSVLRAAFKGDDYSHKSAMEVIDDPERQLLVSQAVWLEVMPKPIYERQEKESKFYDNVFEASECLAWDIELLDHAAHIAKEHGIAAMDAIHVAYALGAHAAELVTKEQPSKPMFRVKDITIRSISVKVATSSAETLLLQLEQSLLDPQTRTPETAASLLADDFVEFSASGQRHARADVLALLQSAPPQRIEASDFQVRFLTPQAALLTYVTVKNGSAASRCLRSSLWRQRDKNWQLAFHQGTPCAQSELE